MKTELTSFQIGQRRFLEGNISASITAFSDALQKNESPVWAHLSRGVGYLKVGELESALNDFDSVVRLDSTLERGFFYRGIAYLNLGVYDRAVDDLSKALKLNPERGAAYLARSLAYYELKRDAEAKSDLENAYVRNNVEIGHFIEEYAVSKNMFDRSIALFEGDRGPWRLLLTEDEVIRMNSFQERDFPL